MINENQIEELFGRDVYSTDGDKIGSTGQVYLDDETGRPEWVTVNTGFFGTNESFVPLARAELTGQDRVAVPYDKSTVKDAPNVASDGGHLDRDEEDQLYRHYGLESGVATQARTDVRTGTGTAAGVGTQTRGDATGGDAMTRSEEQLKVGKDRRETGRARLRKYVTTEQQTVTVPVTKEEVRVEREPITEANRGDALAGDAFTEAEHEVVLHEEQAVVDKEAVPVERVRLGKEQVTENQQVTEEVRKEHIEVDGTADDVKRRDR